MATHCDVVAGGAVVDERHIVWERPGGAAAAGTPGLADWVELWQGTHAIIQLTDGLEVLQGEQGVPRHCALQDDAPVLWHCEGKEGTSDFSFPFFYSKGAINGCLFLPLLVPVTCLDLFVSFFALDLFVSSFFCTFVLP